MSTGKFSKYIKYAIGEILLVVIGILIALQVNNLNQKRLLVIEEVKALKEIRQGFLYDQEDLFTNIDVANRTVASGSIILDHMLTDEPYHDSLATHFSTSLLLSRFISKDGPYDVLKSKGMHLISNDSIRNRIIEMHDASYQSLKTWETGYSVSDRFIQQECLKYFDVVEIIDIGPDGYNPGVMTPFDYESLRRDQYYRTMLTTFRNQTKMFGYRTGTVLEKLTVLIEDLDKEINRLEND